MGGIGTKKEQGIGDSQRQVGVQKSLKLYLYGSGMKFLEVEFYTVHEQQKLIQGFLNWDFWQLTEQRPSDSRYDQQFVWDSQRKEQHEACSVQRTCQFLEKKRKKEDTGSGGRWNQGREDRVGQESKAGASLQRREAEGADRKHESQRAYLRREHFFLSLKNPPKNGN